MMCDINTKIHKAILTICYEYYYSKQKEKTKNICNFTDYSSSRLFRKCLKIILKFTSAAFE